MARTSHTDDLAHFWSLITKDPDGCWTYNGRHRNEPQATIKWLDPFINKIIPTRVNRIIFTLLHGVNGRQFHFHMSCEHQGCVNPNHVVRRTLEEFQVEISSEASKQKRVLEAINADLQLIQSDPDYLSSLITFNSRISKAGPHCKVYNSRTLEQPIARILFNHESTGGLSVYTPTDRIIFILNSIMPLKLAERLFHDCGSKGCVNHNHMIPVSSKEYIQRMQQWEPSGLVPVRRRTDGSIIPDGIF